MAGEKNATEVVVAVIPDKELEKSVIFQDEIQQ